MSKEKKEKIPRTYEPWAMVLATACLPMTVQEQYEYKESLRNGLKAESPPFDPSNLIDFEKSLFWPNE
jgi:hypothetical protein